MTLAANCDILVVGGGINGTGIACDAAGRGLKVVLCEADDLASATSSASTKLIHGGLRYLEHYEFRLVREALAEREVLLRRAPHLIWPLRFVLPHQPHLRPKWMIRTGLWIYDNLYRRRLIPASSAIDLASLAGDRLLKEEFRDGFAYWDCWVDDARLVVANARAARDASAEILTRTRFVSATANGDLWRARLSADGGTERLVNARVIVNAAGPWVDAVQQAIDTPADGATSKRSRVRLVKGSHIVIPRLTTGKDAFIFQNEDGRVIFVLPYEGNFSLIGTTDVDYDGSLDKLSITDAEITYLLDAIRPYVRSCPGREDVVWSYSGVRPLYNDNQSDASEVSRDYRLELTQPAQGGAILSVLGGKITTYRRLAEEALSRLEPLLPGCGKAWTRDARLPGGELHGTSFEDFVLELAAANPWLDTAVLQGLTRRHGSDVAELLLGIDSMAGLGAHIGHDLYQREVEFLRRQEWAKTPEDVLWRRTKTGLHLTELECQRARELLEAML